MPFLNVLKNFTNSEKAVAAGVLVIAATVFAALGRITIEQWMDYTQILLGIYVGGKAVQGAASAISGGTSAKHAHDRITELEARLDANDAEADAALADKEDDDDDED